MKLLHALFVVALTLFSTMAFAEAIDINTATAEQLEKGVKGIGPKKAADIVKYREANGPFQSVDDLSKVSGIKGKTLEKIKPLVTVGGARAGGRAGDAHHPRHVGGSAQANDTDPTHRAGDSGQTDGAGDAHRAGDSGHRAQAAVIAAQHFQFARDRALAAHGAANAL